MCQSCFNQHWEGRTPGVADGVRQVEVIRCALALLHHPDLGIDIDGWVWDWSAGGACHVPVEDDNYEVEIDDGSVAGGLWNALSEDERSVVVSMLAGYDIPDGRRFLLDIYGILRVGIRGAGAILFGYSRYLPEAP